MGEAFTFEAKYLPGLATGRNLELGITIQGGDLYLSTKSSFSEVYR